MIKRIITAFAVCSVNLIVYQYTSAYAVIERGHSYEVFGGEDMLFLFGMCTALYILVSKPYKKIAKKEKDDCQLTTAFSIESEDSDK